MSNSIEDHLETISQKLESLIQLIGGNADNTQLPPKEEVIERFEQLKTQKEKSK